MFTGKLNNSAGRPRLLWTNSKPGKNTRSVRVYGLFGGKKDDKGDDSKVRVLLPSYNNAHVKANLHSL